jgi:proton glutamate symport protein
MNSLTAKVLVALVIGMAIGIAISAYGDARLIDAAGFIEPIGTLWINAIRMTVIPLVVGAIVVGVATTPDLRTMGSLGGRAILAFLVTLTAASILSVLLAPYVLSLLHIDPAAAEALRTTASGASATAVESAHKIQTARQWLTDLVPTNPIKAAADGAMLPLIVFTVAFAVALTRIPNPGRDTILNFARGLTDASLTLVRWILVVAPIGVFALSISVSLKLGIAAAGAAAFYVVLVCSLCVVIMGILYLAVWLFAHTPGVAFPRYWAPPQAMAFSARSSLVSLPAMIEASEAMQQPLAIRTFFLPLAAAMFRVGSAINIPIGVLFLARLYGVDVSTSQLITIALTSVVTTFSVPSIPGATIIVMVPVLLAANLPVEGVGILLAIDTLPDMFRTTANVTGHMSVAALLSRTRSLRASE